MLTLAHDFLLVTLDDHSGNSSSTMASCSRPGSAPPSWGEMQFRDRLAPVPEGRANVPVDPLSDGLMGRVEQALVDCQPAEDAAASPQAAMDVATIS